MRSSLAISGTSRLRRRGLELEWVTLSWNVVGVVVLAVLAKSASSTALAGFGLDSLIEIGASTVVLWELSGTGEQRQRRALQLIGGAFVALAIYLLVQSTVSRRGASRVAERRRDRVDGGHRDRDVLSCRGQSPDRTRTQQPCADHRGAGDFR